MHISNNSHGYHPLALVAVLINPGCNQHLNKENLRNFLFLPLGLKVKTKRNPSKPPCLCMPWQLELIHMNFAPEGVFRLALLASVSTQIGWTFIIKGACEYNNSQCSCKITKMLRVQFLFYFLSKTSVSLIGYC